MAKSTHVNTKIRTPRAGQTGTLVGVRLQPDMLAAVDKFVTDKTGITRPEAIRLILNRWLRENQMLDPKN